MMSADTGIAATDGLIAHKQTRSKSAADRQIRSRFRIRRFPVYIQKKIEESDNLFLTQLSHLRGIVAQKLFKHRLGILT